MTGLKRKFPYREPGQCDDCDKWCMVTKDNGAWRCDECLQAEHTTEAQSESKARVDKMLNNPDWLTRY